MTDDCGALDERVLLYVFEHGCRADPVDGLVKFERKQATFLSNDIMEAFQVLEDSEEHVDKLYNAVSDFIEDEVAGCATSQGIDSSSISLWYATPVADEEHMKRIRDELGVETICAGTADSMGGVAELLGKGINEKIEQVNTEHDYSHAVIVTIRKDYSLGARWLETESQEEPQEPLTYINMFVEKHEDPDFRGFITQLYINPMKQCKDENDEKMLHMMKQAFTLFFDTTDRSEDEAKAVTRHLQQQANDICTIVERDWHRGDVKTESLLDTYVDLMVALHNHAYEAVTPLQIKIGEITREL